jgi:putative CocE/NonD family hydrolase
MQESRTGQPGGTTRRAFMQGAGAALLAGGALPEFAFGAADDKRMGPRRVRMIENIWIPMPDGTRIAARMWIPDDADRNPVPAIMEYIPYRKRDGTRLYDETRHPYLASYGYACVRADIRGAGDSDGLPQDEYVRQEQDDGVEIIAWLAKQPWCTGKVGLFGISWGGFSALQVAARRPPALKAIITHCSTDDRYADDAHYLGGCIVQDNFVWGAMHTLNGLRPPDPAIVGEGWREQWRRRLEALEFYVGNWVSHPHRDAFWKHGSVAEDYGQIQCAVYAVGGWVDAYSPAIPRMLAGLSCPRKGLVGPWGHQYPHQGDPGPAIDWLTEGLRWWDHWLKDEDTGIMNEPMYRVWMLDEPVLRGMHETSGRWVAETAWPSDRIERRRYYLTADGLRGGPEPERALTLSPLQTVGITAPHWCPFNMDTELPTDQRIDDARSLTFDTTPLESDLEMLGAPVAHLEVSFDQPVAFLSVRLNEVRPDGPSSRITYAVLNACHRDSHEFPTALEPGRRYRIRVTLRDAAYRFKAGSRIRVSVSTTAWPLIWPSPQPVRMTLHAGPSEIEIPVRPSRAEDASLRDLGSAYVPDPGSRTVLEPGSRTDGSKSFEWQVDKQTLVIRSHGSGGRYIIDETGTELSGAWQEVSEIRDDDANSATLVHSRWQGFRRGDWNTRAEAELRVAVTREDFLLTGTVRTFDGDQEFFSRVWERRIPRRFV